MKELHETCSKLNEAREVLLDKKKREMYDRGMYDPNNQGGFESGFHSAGGGVFDIFGEMFGGGGRNSRRKNESTEVKINITLSDSYIGKSKKYKVNRIKRCVSCDGKGSESSTICSGCAGKGRVMRRIQRGPFATLAEEICPTCRGNKHIKKGPACAPCGGNGMKNEPEIVSVDLPRGIKSGTKLLLEGKGDESEDPDVETGDLLLVISIKESEMISFCKQAGIKSESNKVDVWFERVGNNLVTEIEIDLPSFLKGGKAVVFLPDETRNIIKFDSLMNSSKLIVVSGRGFGQRGDLIIKYSIKPSPNLISGGLLGKKINTDVKISDLEEKVPEGTISNVFSTVLKKPEDCFKATHEEERSERRRGPDLGDLFGEGGFRSGGFSFF